MDDPQAQCISWIQTVFGECITTHQQAFSFLLGYLSIFCWLNAQIPQIIENFRLGSAASLSLPFLVNWLLGDISNLIGCILTHQLPFQFYLAYYFCVADIILFGQWIYYSYQESKRSILPEVAIGDLTEISETDPHHHHHHHHHHHSRTHSRSHSRRTTLTGASVAAIANDLAQDDAMADSSIHELDGGDSSAPLIPQPRPRRLTTASDIAHRKSTSMVLFGLMLLTMRQTLPGLQQQGASGILDQTNSKSEMMGRVFSRSLEGEQLLVGDSPLPPDQNIVILGRIFAWVCTIFYLSSRMPQLWKNYKRKSVRGLSILMFFWAALGNLTYSLSILNSADAVNPDTRHKFLREAVPYLLGSSGTLMFDVSIFGQWLYYTGKLNMFFANRSHHHRHHRHYHPRQPGRSRTQSRVESMVLSPSASQSGGMYNILINEDEDNDTDQAMSTSQLLVPQSDIERSLQHHEGQDRH